MRLWERRSFAWTAASSSVAFAAIFDRQTAVYPNDFALDDLDLVAFSGAYQDEIGSPAATAIPEPSIYLAGALLLLPFGVQAARRLRNCKPVA